MLKYRYTVAVLLAGILWGIIGLFIRTLSAAGFNSMQIVFIRASLSMLMLLCGLLIGKRSLLKIRLRDLWCFIGTGLCSLTFFNFCYFYTMTETSLSIASVLLYTAPIFVAVMSAVLFKEKLTPIKVLCLMLALLGCVLVTGVLSDARALSTVGIFTGLGAGIGYALYSIFGRYALERGYHTLTVNFWTFLVATLSLLPFAKLEHLGAELATGDFPWLAAVMLVILSTVLPYLLYTYGLTGMESGRASVLATVEPVVATLTGVVCFHETVTVSGAFGMLLVLLAVILLNLPQKTVFFKKKKT